MAKRQGLLTLLPTPLKDLLRTATGKPAPFGLTDSTKRRLRGRPRRTREKISFRGKPLFLADAASFLAAHEEIFVRRSYAFSSHRQAGLIIDAGANVGLSSLWFTENYPNYRIIAIEADPDIFDILRQNVELQNTKNVVLVNRAVWDTDDELLCFSPDGADGGRVLDNATGKIQSIRLRHLLEAQPVEMLKIDIEGAEVRVLDDCRDALGNVTNLFVEYHSCSDEPQRLAQLLDVLQDSGFRYYLENPGPHSSHPLLLQESDSGHDLRINIWATRNPSSENL
jgi:FkbM family methyltransferase